MNISRFNRVVRRRDGRLVLFNLNAGAIAELDGDTAKKVSDGLLPSGQPIVDQLRSIGAIVDSDELATLETEFEARRHGGSTFSLTIAPTLDCNFSCDYCYQDAYRNSRAMTDETAIALINYVEIELHRRKSRTLRVTWYGGEPLLQLQRVISVMSQLKELTAKLNVSLAPASIITNGLLLDENAASALRSVGVHRAQISIDSLFYEAGTKRGALLQGSERPSPILSNAARAKDHIEVQVRVNVSRRNVTDLPQILQAIDVIGLGRESYIARVEDADGESGYETLADGARRRVEGTFRGIPIVTRDENLLSRKQVAKLELAHHFSELQSALTRSLEKLKPKTHFCSATSGDLVVVDPKGQLSQCWHSAGIPGEAIRSLHPEPNETGSGVRRSWSEYSPFAYKSCRSCEVLPLCMGGCSHARVLLDSPHAPCESIKYQVQEALEVVANSLEL